MADALDTLKSSLAYDGETGAFRWRVSKRGLHAGSVAGTMRRDGYVKITVDGAQYLAHRLAWAFRHGCFPVGEIDHIDRNPANNRIANLREANSAQNKVNRKVRYDNASGFTGVALHKSGKWHVRIGDSQYVGLYSSKQEAVEARDVAARAVYGNFIPEVCHR